MSLPPPRPALAVFPLLEPPAAKDASCRLGNPWPLLSCAYVYACLSVSPGLTSPPKRTGGSAGCVSRPQAGEDAVLSLRDLREGR